MCGNRNLGRENNKPKAPRSEQARGGRNREQASLPGHDKEGEVEGVRSRQAGRSLRAPRPRETPSDPKRHGSPGLLDLRAR